MIFLEWFCFCAVLMSTWLYGRRDASGPFVGIIGAAAFITYGITAGIPAAALTNAAFLMVHIRNFTRKA